MARYKILTFTVMYFFQAWTLGVDSKMVHLHDPKYNIDIDMAPESVDDSYKGCEHKMLRMVNDHYLQKERQDYEDFNKAWTAAEAHYKEKGKLPKIYSLAIQVYVNATANIYKLFNKATRTQKKNYIKSFKYHSLHFLLNNALRILNKNNIRKRLFKTCFHTFRGTNVTFHHNQNTIMRFGPFTSSSFDKEIAKRFGSKSCFEIDTYFGAPLGVYSQLAHEKEVLIPPYKVFKVTNKEDKKGLWCDVVYKLESTKKEKSDLKCKIVEPLQGE